MIAQVIATSVEVEYGHIQLVQDETSEIGIPVIAAPRLAASVRGCKDTINKRVMSTIFSITDIYRWQLCHRFEVNTDTRWSGFRRRTSMTNTHALPQ